jgi:hypothetical protein
MRFQYGIFLISVADLKFLSCARRVDTGTQIEKRHYNHGFANTFTFRIWCEVVGLRGVANAGITGVGSAAISYDGQSRGEFMIRRIAGVASMALLAWLSIPALRAQDIPGIEICTVEKTMERRTSCLQSNVDFLQKTITKLTADHQQKLDAANRQIEALKAAVIALQKTADDLRSALAKQADDLKKKADALPAKESAPAKEGGK